MIVLEKLRQHFLPRNADVGIFSFQNSSGEVRNPNPAYRSTCIASLHRALQDNVQASLGGMKTEGKSYIVKPDQIARRWRTSIECISHYGHIQK